MASSLRTGSLYFGQDATKNTLTAIVGDVITFCIILAGIATAAAWYYVKQEATSVQLVTTLLDILFDFLIPFLSGLSFLVAVVLTFRAITRTACTNNTTTRPGRKAM